jgi:hypothetical protein
MNGCTMAASRMGNLLFEGGAVAMLWLNEYFGCVLGYFRGFWGTLSMGIRECQWTGKYNLTGGRAGDKESILN